jgi:hypothetical protein
MMQQQWMKIFSSKSLAEAAIVQGMLEENSVPVQLLNRQDSSYLNFGEVELYVPAHLQQVATALVGKVLNN